MRSGFNPIRRNRNIGTAKQGHGRDNRMVIPSICYAERVWWEQLREHQLVRREVCGRDLLFIVEKVHRNFCYPTSVDDVCTVLSSIPDADWIGLQTFVFRQSTRKQLLISPSWGRIAFAADIGVPGKRNVYSGPAVFLEAMNVSARWRWGKSLTPPDMQELERLRQDGHDVQDLGSCFEITSNSQCARATQLYRTLLHEIGHWVDWLERVEKPSEAGNDLRNLVDAFWSRTKQERDAFAHRYADLTRSRLARQNLIPFARIEPPPMANL